METPLVSIVTITYNHEPYIRKCIEGVLMQQVNFPIEFIIAEDCSTDGTLAICKEYAEKHPDIIKIITSENNVGALQNEVRAINAAKGKYLAFCEGDDYWTDPLKLQKQVDFLEAHPDYSVCFTRYKIYYEKNNTTKPGYAEFLFKPNQDIDYVELDLETSINVWCTQYLTLVCRKDAYDNELHKKYNYYRDTHQVYHLMLAGKCAILNMMGGMYNITGCGEHSHRDAINQLQMTLAVDTELWKFNNDLKWEKLYIRVMQNLIDIYDGRKDFEFVKYAFKVYFMQGGIRKFIYNIRRIIMLYGRK